MKRIMICTTALAAIVPAGQAMAATDWSGAFVGATAGWASADFDATSVPLVPFGDGGEGGEGGDGGEGCDEYFCDESVSSLDLTAANLTNIASLSADGGAGSAVFGINQQFGSFVVGIAAEAGFLDLDDSIALPGAPIWPDSITDAAEGSFSGSPSASFETGLFVQAMVKAGFAFDNTLIYATAGYGGVDVDVNITEYVSFAVSAVGSCNGGFAGYCYTSTADRFVDYVAYGAGIEHAFSDRWSVKLEYVHLDLEEITIQSQLGDSINDSVLYEIDGDIDMIKVGINYKLGQ